MRRKRDSQADPPAASERFAWLDASLLAAVTALGVATPLIPSEATVRDGVNGPLVLLWLLVLCAWAAGQALRPNPKILFGWTGTLAAALIGWHTLAGLVAGMQGNGRQALNVIWQFIAYGVAAFLLRQLLRSPFQCRAFVVVMIALAAAQATHGYYQYFVTQPANRAHFEANPEAAYREHGLTTDAQKQQLRWRVESVEPLATFGLTNSLAGLLAPWLVALLGIGLSLVGQKIQTRAAIGVVFLAVLIGGCLLLTKSRTGILATGVGIVLLAIYGRSGGWRFGWKIPAAIAGVAVVLGLAAVRVGGLDVQVLSQAPTSVLYRLQYWQSTAAMIAEHWLFGVGPGQFQAWYTRYKLPQASETIADPHNFLLEIWSTAGTPALLALLAMGVAFAWQLSRSDRDQAEAEHSHDAMSRLPLYFGGAIGFALAIPLAQAFGYSPSLVGLPVAAIGIVLLDGWVTSGKLHQSVPVIALLVLLINLLAAGATSFPGVFQTTWILLPVALANRASPAWTWQPKSFTGFALVLASLALVFLCSRTLVSPVLEASTQLARAEEALATRQPHEAEAALLAATQADPWSPVPWHRLAELRFQHWLATQSDDDWHAFQSASGEFARRDPHHEIQFTAQGNWRLSAWRRSNDPTHLAAAIDAYRQAAAWYPERALMHAQLAWALHLAGDANEAAATADRAKALDAQNPHAEQKLSRQTVYDPSLEPATAEQIVRRLRSSTGLETLP
jgi:hypothetical protein